MQRSRLRVTGGQRSRCKMENRPLVVVTDGVVELGRREQGGFSRREVVALDGAAVATRWARRKGQGIKGG